MNSNEIFAKMSENIINTLNRFKKGDIDTSFMNEKITLDLSSVCKFIKDKRNLNNSNLEIVIPVTRFEQNLCETLSEEKFNQIENNNVKIIGKQKDIDDYQIKYNESKEENTFLKDIKKNEDFSNSLVSGSLFSQSYNYGNKSEFRVSVIDEKMSKANISTIYGREINYGNEDIMSVISNTSFAKFLNQKLHYKANRFNDFSYTYYLLNNI
jgi:hypothetical protein